MLHRIGLRSLFIGLILVLLSACAEPQTFSIHDGLTDSDSTKFQNIVSQFIIENGFGNHVIYFSSASNEAENALLNGNVYIVHSADQPSMVADGEKISKAGNYFISKKLMKDAPQIVSFLSKMHIDETIIAECLQWAEDKGTDFDGAALYFLLNYQSKWSTWIEEKTYQAAKKVLRAQISNSDLKDEF